VEAGVFGLNSTKKVGSLQVARRQDTRYKIQNTKYKIQNTKEGHDEFELE
jgi:hypothetical protein